MLQIRESVKILTLQPSNTCGTASVGKQGDNEKLLHSTAYPLHIQTLDMNLSF